jgi:Arc/MetJ-type ribon-helix-helix transcriptional regulator
MGVAEPSLRRFIDELIASGRHANADEVMETALRHYRAVLTEQDEHDAMVRREAARGIAAIEAGDFEYFENAAALRAVLKQRLDRLEAAEKGQDRG